MRVQFVVTGRLMSLLVRRPTALTHYDRALYHVAVRLFSNQQLCTWWYIRPGADMCSERCNVLLSPSSLTCCDMHFSPAGIRKGYLIFLTELWLILLTSSLTASMEDKANGSVDVKRYCVMSVRHIAQLFQRGGCFKVTSTVCWHPQPRGERSAARPGQLGSHRCRQLLQSDRVRGASHCFPGSGRKRLLSRFAIPVDTRRATPASKPRRLNPPLPTQQEIDGKSLLLMTRNDVLTGLSIKLGPALKIYEYHVKPLQTQHLKTNAS